MMRAMSGMPEGRGERPTPYELVFAGGAFEGEHFPAIRVEARERDVAAWNPDAFVLLASVGALLRELPPEGAGADSLRELGLLLFQGYHFWLYGRRTYVVERALARRLLAQPPVVGEWELTPPHPAGYLQLPRSLVWARVGADAPAEPVDGLFWTMVGRQDPATPPYERLDVLLALGLRADRPGLSVVPVDVSLPGGPGHWADVRARESEPGAPAVDFANVLPGGELGGLHSLVNEAEVLKLVSLLFWHAAAHPEAVAPGGPGAAAELHVLRDVAAGG